MSEEQRERIEGEVAAEIAGFIAEEKDDDARFDSIARRLFAYQFEYNAPYQRFCSGRGVTPGNVTAWRDIPAAPAAAFKRFALTCAPEDACSPERGGRVFHSSGTTQAETSRHFMDAAALELYRKSLTAAYSRFVPDTCCVFALMPPPNEAPHSSLSFMLDAFKPFFLWPQAETDRKLPAWTEVLACWLRMQRKHYTIFGTAFAFMNFFDSTDERFKLPEYCAIVETGGFKGRSREVSRDELYGLFTERLGASPTRCISEYGMSEMASQFYDSTAVDDKNGIDRPTRKVAAPWLKTRFLSPITGADAEPGQPGLLCHYDLANLNSVFAIQTEDYGIAAEDGDGFHLLGRAPGAILRGCSLSTEEMLNWRSNRVSEAGVSRRERHPAN